MLNRYKRNKKTFFPRVIQAIKKELSSNDLYGLAWGDPETVEPLKFVRDQYVLPYVDAKKCAVEIGPGGGRWTRYLLGFKKLYVVDYYPEILEELQHNFKNPNIEFIRNNGTDFPNIDMGSIDFVFSFGAFVHMDTEIIEAYLKNIKPILKPGADVVIHYSDKTKIMAQKNESFSENTPDIMREMVLRAGYKICGEDLTTMWHSSIIHCSL